MGDDEARALVQRWWDGIWGEGDLSIVEELVAEPYVRHTGMGSERLSHAEYKKKLVQTRRVMRGAVTRIDDQVVAGDKVWSRATSHGINLEGESAPTVMTWMVVHRIADGKIAETWAITAHGLEWDQT